MKGNTVNRTQNHFRSANIHICGTCNYHCGFCFAKSMVKTSRPFEEWRPIFQDLRFNQGIKKINFVGGEPLMYPDLIKCCQYCKELGFTVSIVSNGSLIDRDFLQKTKGCIDWIGLSIDSTDDAIEKEVGRCNRCKEHNHVMNVIAVSRLAHEFGIKVKLNITAIRQSYQQDFSEIIRITNPERVKVFHVMKIEGDNDLTFDEYSITTKQFDQFRKRHENIVLSNGQKVVFEKENDMIDSYLMIDPLGRIMRNTNNVHTTEPYDDFIKKGIDNSLDVDKYVERGGIYEWDAPAEEDERYNTKLPSTARIAVFGITRSGKDTAIKETIEKIYARYGVVFKHFPFMETMQKLSEETLFKDFSETTQNEKGMLMVKYREMISDRSRYPFVITDEHYSFPETYGGKELHNEYTDAKFPFMMVEDKMHDRRFEVLFDEKYIDMYDDIFYLAAEPEEILERIRESEPPKNNPYITLEDIREWSSFELCSLFQLCMRRGIPLNIMHAHKGQYGDEIAEEFGLDCTARNSSHNEQ